MIAEQLARLVSPGMVALNPADDRYYGITPSMSQAGENVTPDTALQVDAFFACLRVVTESLGYSPWFVYRRLANGGRERAPEHPVYRLLHDQPNPWQTAFEWKEMAAGHIILRGHSYNEIVPGPSGPFDQIVPLHPDRVRVEKLPSGLVRYKVRDANGIERMLAYDQVFHIPGLWGGKSILEAARENIGEALAAQSHSASSLRNGVNAAGALKHPGSFANEDAAKRIRGSFQEAYGGASNAGKVMIFEEGMDWVNLGLTSRDAQYLETRQAGVPAIARRFRMPLTMIGYESNTSNFGTGVEQYQIGFVVFTMLPWYGRFESRGNTDLMVDPVNYYTEFEPDAMLRGDAKTQAEALQIERQNGVINGDEWRRLKNRNRIEDGSGETFWRPANMVPADTPVGTIGRAPGSGNAASDPRTERYARVLAGQVVRKEQERVKALAKRYADDGLGWETSVREFYGELAGEISERCYIEPADALRYCAEARDDLLERGVLSIEGAGESKGAALTALMLGADKPATGAVRKRIERDADGRIAGVVEELV